MPEHPAAPRRRAGARRRAVRRLGPWLAAVALTVASLPTHVTATFAPATLAGSATVASQGQTTFTNASGDCTLSGLSLPYDLVIATAIDDGSLHVYEGLTTATPRLRPTFAIEGSLGISFDATVAGSFGGGALAVDERVVVCVEGLAVAVYGCDRASGGDAGYSIAVN